MKKGGGLPEIKRINRVHIKEMIYQRAPITRSEIADRLALTLPTVTTSVADMLAEGILCERELDSWSAGPQGGRRPAALDFVPGAAYALGAELGPYGTMAVVTDVRGNVVAKSKLPPAQDNYQQMLEALAAQLRELIRHLPGRRVLGLGVGLPGFIEAERGIVRSTLHPSWNARALAQDLSRALELPAVVDNNARMRLSAEAVFTRSWRPDVFAYFFISRGIACPVTLKTGVWTGCTAGAGEIGHMIVQPQGPKCPLCGHHGCLDAVASETAVLRQCREACREGRAPVLQRLAGERPLDMGLALQAQAQGDPAVCGIFEQAVRYQGIALANISNLLSPGLVLVDGYMMDCPQNQKRLREVASHYLYGLNSEEIRMEFLPFDQYRGARGAAARIVQKYWLEK